MSERRCVNCLNPDCDVEIEANAEDCFYYVGKSDVDDSVCSVCGGAIVNCVVETITYRVDDDGNPSDALDTSAPLWGSCCEDCHTIAGDLIG